MTERLGKRGNIFEIEFRSGCLGWRGELPAQRKKILQRFLVVHFSQSEGQVRKRRTISILCGERQRPKIRVRAKIPSVETLPAISDESSVRSRAGRRIRLTRPAPQYLNHQALRNSRSRHPSSGQSKSKCTAALHRRDAPVLRKLWQAA